MKHKNKITLIASSKTMVWPLLMTERYCSITLINIMHMIHIWKKLYSYHSVKGKTYLQRERNNRVSMRNTIIDLLKHTQDAATKSQEMVLKICKGKSMFSLIVQSENFCCMIYTETKMSSFWRNFHHWLHWKLSFWQLPVQPVMNISSKWRLFRFSVIHQG